MIEGKPLCCFNCLGEVNVNRIDLHDDGFFRSYEETSIMDLSSSNDFDKPGTVLLFERTWDKGSALYNHIKLFFKMIRCVNNMFLLDQNTYYYFTN